MERMTESQPVFIRCIKPNSRKSSNLFEDDYVKAQVRLFSILFAISYYTVEEEETLSNNITLDKHIHNLIIVHLVILSGNRMAVRHLLVIPSCKLYISEF